MFPVRRVYCVGRNYAAHAIEMGGDPDREAPFFFQKNPDNLTLTDGVFPYPSQSSDVHHEVELVVALHRGPGHCGRCRARSCVRLCGRHRFHPSDRQAEAKAAGRPWEVAKAFEQSGPLSPLVPASRIGHPTEGRIWLSVNDTPRQEGNVNQMSWKVPEIIAELSRLFTLAPGDVIFTGTPSGVGPVERGDRVTCGVEGVAALAVSVR